MSQLLALLLVVVFCAVPVGWLCAVRLVQIARQANSRALNERATAAVLIAFGTTVYFMAALNAAWGFAWFNQEATQLVARFAVASIMLAPLRWLWLYEKGRF